MHSLGVHFYFVKRRYGCFGKGRELENQLKFLKNLQALDSALENIENMKSALPIKLQQIEKEFEQKEKKIEKEKAVWEETEKERRRKEQQLKIETEKLQKAQEKLLSVKTNKEYHAVLNELEDIKRTASDVETDILVCMEKGDRLSQTLKTKEIEHQKWIEEFEKRKHLFVAEINEAEQELQDRQKLRAEIAEKINSDLIQKYERLREKRQGLAVVAIHDGFCQGCNMNIPPQRFLEIRKNSNNIMNCPFCNRILYFEEKPNGDNKIL